MCSPPESHPAGRGGLQGITRKGIPHPLPGGQYRIGEAPPMDILVPLPAIVERRSRQANAPGMRAYRRTVYGRRSATRNRASPASVERVVTARW